MNEVNDNEDCFSTRALECVTLATELWRNPVVFMHDYDHPVSDSMPGYRMATSQSLNCVSLRVCSRPRPTSMNKQVYQFRLIIGLAEIPTASDKFTVFASHELLKARRMMVKVMVMAVAVGQFLKEYSNGISARSRKCTILKGGEAR